MSIITDFRFAMTEQKSRDSIESGDDSVSFGRVVREEIPVEFGTFQQKVPNSKRTERVFL